MSIKVELAVYDLSRGMATMMSEQILGQRIDGIWHTGVVVFGIEYYFGGGIQSTPYGIFAAQNNMPCSRLLNIGNTTKTRSELEAFLRSIRSQFSMSTYDLINNNCNNFCDTVCKFLTTNNIGIPSYIVGLPRIVFSTPGGAMLRPMIESMQSSIHQQQASMDPFGNSAAMSAYADTTTSSYASPYSKPTPATTSVSSFAPTFTSATTTPTTQPHHVSTAIEAMRAAEFENRLSEGVMSTIATALISNNSNNNDISLLQLNTALVNQPITFSDVGNLRLLMDKVILTVNNNNAAAGLLSDSEITSLSRVVDILSLSSSKSDNTSAVTSNNNTNKNDDDNVYATFLSLPIHKDPALLSSISYLSLLRLIVLQPPFATATAVSHHPPSPLLSVVFTRLIAELNDTSGKGLYKPPAVSNAIRAVAMSVLVNYLALPTAASIADDDLMNIATVNLAHSSDSKVTLRMTASALAMNITIACTTNIISSVPSMNNNRNSNNYTTNNHNNHQVKAVWQQHSTKINSNDISATSAISMSSASSDVELHPHAVQMLCSAIECLSSDSSNSISTGEVNQTIRLRELIIVYRILTHCGSLAVSLATDLGLTDIITDSHSNNHNLLLTAHHQQHSTSNGDVNNNTDITLRKDEAVLIREIRKLLFVNFT